MHRDLRRAHLRQGLAGRARPYHPGHGHRADRAPATRHHRADRRADRIGSRQMANARPAADLRRRQPLHGAARCGARSRRGAQIGRRRCDPLDCIGFTERHRAALAGRDMPVILSNAVVAKAVGELFGETNHDRRNRSLCPGPAISPGSKPGGPLSDLTSAAKDLFDVAGHPTGGGNPDWVRIHPVPTRHALQLLRRRSSVYHDGRRACLGRQS